MTPTLIVLLVLFAIGMSWVIPEIIIRIVLVIKEIKKCRKEKEKEKENEIH